MRSKFPTMKNVIIKHLASPEAWEMLNKPFVRYLNTQQGYESAVCDHRELMDFELGAEEHPEIQQLLVDRRWKMAEYYQKLHKWDVQC